jgi:parallel beta-helix repeat protein
MRKKPFMAALSIFALLFSGQYYSPFVGVVVANLAPPPTYLPWITIQSNGSITPQVQYISRSGDTYRLTTDIKECPIMIECDNIVFDGSGYSTTITEGDNMGVALSYTNNVTVKNINIQSKGSEAVYLNNCSFCSITGIKASDATKSIFLLRSSNNIVTECNSGIELND